MRTASGVSGLAAAPLPGGALAAAALPVGALAGGGAVLLAALDAAGAGAVGAPAGVQAALSEPTSRLPRARPAVSWRRQWPGCTGRCTRCLLVWVPGDLTPPAPLPCEGREESVIAREMEPRLDPY